MLIRQEQRLKVLIVSWNEKWISSEVYVFAPTNLAFCGYLLLLACSVRKRSYLSEQHGMWQEKKSTSGAAKLLCFGVLQTVLKHAVSKLKHVTQVHAVHNRSVYRDFVLCFFAANQQICSLQILCCQQVYIIPSLIAFCLLQKKKAKPSDFES